MVFRLCPNCLSRNGLQVFLMTPRGLEQPVEYVGNLRATPQRAAKGAALDEWNRIGAALAARGLLSKVAAVAKALLSSTARPLEVL